MRRGAAAGLAMKLEPGVSFLREVASEWSKDNALSLGAALAFYTLFSLAPLLLLIIAIVGLVFGRAAAQGEIVARVAGAVGPEAATVIEGMIKSASAPASGVIATVVSLATMLFGASGVFGQLQTSLNQIWGVTAGRRRGVRGMVRQRLASFSLILGIGFLLFLSLLVSAVLAGVHELVAAHLPALSGLLQPANFLISFLMITALFALIFKMLPDARMRWRDVWPGAAVTALLFTVGKTLIGLYLGRTGRTSVYGAAASLVVLLLWVYYSAQILLIGAEFTEVYSRRYGSRREDASA
jgi:membrane protein